jgi:hypothetical protein
MFLGAKQIRVFRSMKNPTDFNRSTDYIIVKPLFLMVKQLNPFYDPSDRMVVL